MNLNGKRVLMVVAPQDFRDEELFIARASLEGRGATVTVGSTRRGTTRGMSGGVAEATVEVENVEAEIFDAVLVVGGDGAEIHLWGHTGLHQLVQRAIEGGRVVGASCVAPVVLARAGLARDREIAVHNHRGAREELRRACARLSPRAVVADHGVVTCASPDALDAWATLVAAELIARNGIYSTVAPGSSLGGDSLFAS